jgi:hypothetical protein
MARASWSHVGTAMAAILVAGCTGHSAGPGVVDGVVRGYGGPLTFVNGSPTPAMTGQPLKDLEVTVLRDGSRVAVTTTDSDGRFSLRLPRGSYLISVCNIHKSVTVHADQGDTLDLACAFT